MPLSTRDSLNTLYLSVRAHAGLAARYGVRVDMDAGEARERGRTPGRESLCGATDWSQRGRAGHVAPDGSAGGTRRSGSLSAGLRDGRLGLHAHLWPRSSGEKVDKVTCRNSICSGVERVRGVLFRTLAIMNVGDFIENRQMKHTLPYQIQLFQSQKHCGAKVADV